MSEDQQSTDLDLFKRLGTLLPDERRHLLKLITGGTILDCHRAEQVEWVREAHAIGDMGEGLKLKIFFEDDGDAIVSIMPIDEALSDQTIQFCTGQGGGKNPEIVQALRSLAAVMSKPPRHLFSLRAEDRNSGLI